MFILHGELFLSARKSILYCVNNNPLCAAPLICELKPYLVFVPAQKLSGIE